MELTATGRRPSVPHKTSCPSPRSLARDCKPKLENSDAHGEKYFLNRRCSDWAASCLRPLSKYGFEKPLIEIAFSVLAFASSIPLGRKDKKMPGQACAPSKSQQSATRSRAGTSDRGRQWSPQSQTVPPVPTLRPPPRLQVRFPACTHQFISETMRDLVGLPVNRRPIMHCRCGPEQASSTNASGHGTTNWLATQDIASPARI